MKAQQSEFIVPAWRCSPRSRRSGPIIVSTLIFCGRIGLKVGGRRPKIPPDRAFVSMGMPSGGVAFNRRKGRRSRFRQKRAPLLCSKLELRRFSAQRLTACHSPPPLKGPSPLPDALHVVGAFFASPPRLVSPRCFFAVTLYFSPPGPQVQNQPERSFTSAPILMPSFIMAGAMMFLAASDAPNAAAPFAKALLKRAVVVAYAPSAFMVSSGTVVGILNKKAVPTEYRKNTLRRRRGSLGKAVARGKQLTSAPRGVLFVCGRFIH